MAEVIDLTLDDSDDAVDMVDVEPSAQPTIEAVPILEPTVPPAPLPQPPLPQTEAPAAPPLQPPPQPLPQPIKKQQKKPPQPPPNNESRLSQRERRPAYKVWMGGELDLPRQHPKEARNKKISLETMLAHLDKTSIGLRPADPTVGPLPDDLPPPLHPISDSTQIINLAEWSQEQLCTTAAASLTTDPWAALLRDPPGAEASRLGRFTGQERMELKVNGGGAAAADGGDGDGVLTSPAASSLQEGDDGDGGIASEMQVD